MVNSMESLHEAAELLQRLSGGFHRFCAEKGKKPSADTVFFIGLLNRTICTDRDGSKVLFGTDTCPSTYRSFKSRFCSKLSEALLAVPIDKQQEGEVAWALVECARKAVIVRLCFSFGKNIAALDAVREALAIAEKYHISDVQTEMLRHLQHDAQVRGDMKEFEVITAKRRAALHAAAAAMETEEEYLRIATAASRYSVIPPEVAARATEAMHTLEERYRTVENYGYRIALFRLKLYGYSIAGNHEAAVECCNEAEKYYKIYPQFASSVRLAEVYYRRMSEYILCGKIEDAKNDAGRISGVLREGTQNWGNFMINYFELCMQTLNFTEAASVLGRLERYAANKTTGRAIKERVKLYKGYLWYCHHSGWAEETGNRLTDYIPKQRLPVRSKADYTFSQEDKHGANFALVTLDFLMQLHSGDAYSFSEEACAKYEQRYMKDTPTRAGIFMKLFRLLLHSDSTVSEISAVAVPLLDELASLPRSLDAGEILPFEQLWKHIVGRIYVARKKVV